eukprot:TRINITY_DN4615_c0_g1_i1.p1 TRINITY_DN4615_c0_g1~~TRINITY_DN4615_c0_g1_i1.p1  ORF type:complete len:291 (+),score=47.37 TRINITY_DN4615_c0_g1_i1:181-1053(+)
MEAAARANGNKEPDTGFSCPVCLSSKLPQDKKCILDSCSHEFCVDCISEWAKKQLACPLCKTNFLSASVEFKPDGSFDTKIFEEPKKDPSKAAVDLSGLDFDVFLAESGRLLDNASDAKRKLFCPNGLYWVHGARLTETRAHRALGSVYDRLVQIRQDLRNECKFEPELLWENLQQIDHVLKEIWSGRADCVDISVIALGAPSDVGHHGDDIRTSGRSRRYGANDDYDDQQYDEEEYYDDEEEEYYDDEDDEYYYQQQAHIHISGSNGSARGRNAPHQPAGKLRPSTGKW